MEDFDPEKTVLEEILRDRRYDARYTLRQFTLPELDRLIDALDKLAAIADEEAIRRAEKRR